MNASPSSTGEQSTFQSYFRLNLLGFPTITWKNSILTIPRRSVRALLYRLACEMAPVKRDQLVLLFWPDVPNSVARRNLSHLLTHLRRGLPDLNFLMTSGEEVWLQPGQVWCDALELRNVLLDADADISILKVVETLYQGPFLEGFDLPGCPEFEHWSLLERITLEHQYLRVLGRLVEESTSWGEIGQAIEYARRYLAIDPLSEIIHQKLIQLYAGIGDRHLAIRQYERCSSILESNLGVAPLPETRAVYQAILRERTRFPESSLPLEPPELPGNRVPILGRENELHRLEEIFNQLHFQQGRVVFISGEAGIGKSRLIQDFMKNHQNDAHLLYGCGQAGFQSIPYQPILNILRSILGFSETGAGQNQSTIPTEQTPLDFIDPLWLSEISRLLPEIQTLYPGVSQPLPLGPEFARTRLFDALCHLVLTYADANEPVVLCMDDLQWIDTATKAWLIHIGRFLSRGSYPVMILGAYRSEEAGEILELRQTLSHTGILMELRLSGLNKDDLLKLLHHLVGQRPGDEILASQLFRASGGNPFYLIELIRELVEEGILEHQFQEPHRFSLPQSIREAVQVRLQRLSPISRQVLEAGAVLGQHFDLELLRLTAGRSHCEIMLALEELTSRMLLVEDSQGIKFVHDITRQHVEESLGQVRNQLLHHRAGRAYQHLKPGDFSALAYHFELGADLEKALQYHRQAAQQANNLFAWRVVEFHLGRMLELLKQIDPGCNRSEFIALRGEILTERADISR